MFFRPLADFLLILRRVPDIFEHEAVRRPDWSAGATLKRSS